MTRVGRGVGLGSRSGCCSSLIRASDCAGATRSPCRGLLSPADRRRPAARPGATLCHHSLHRPSPTPYCRVGSNTRGRRPLMSPRCWWGAAPRWRERSRDGGVDASRGAADAVRGARGDDDARWSANRVGRSQCSILAAPAPRRDSAEAWRRRSSSGSYGARPTSSSPAASSPFTPRALLDGVAAYPSLRGQGNPAAQRGRLFRLYPVAGQRRRHGAAGDRRPGSPGAGLRSRRGVCGGWLVRGARQPPAQALLVVSTGSARRTS